MSQVGSEWVGGVVSMPAYVTPPDEPPYRPDALVWLVPGGPMLGARVVKPGELLDVAGESLREAMRESAIERVPEPTRIRVASAELARAIGRAAPASAEIVCAPTPEIDEALADLADHLASQAADRDEVRFLGGDVEAAAAASFFAAAAALYRAAPWKVVPGDDALRVTIAALGVVDGAVAVVGQMGEAYGLGLFASTDDFERYLDGAEDAARGERPRMPAHLAFNFDRGADVPRATRAEVDAYRWEVASAAAYPSLVAIDEELVSRPATARELQIAEAVAKALTELVAKKSRRALAAAWDGAAPFERTFGVVAQGAPVQVTLRAPYDDGGVDGGAEDDEEVDDEALRKELERAPEIPAAGGLREGLVVLDVAADYLGMSIARVDARELREILLDIIPAKVMIDASAAPAIVAQCRAVFAFLERTGRSRHAAGCSACSIATPKAASGARSPTPPTSASRSRRSWPASRTASTSARKRAPTRG